MYDRDGEGDCSVAVNTMKVFSMILTVSSYHQVWAFQLLFFAEDLISMLVQTEDGRRLVT